MAQSKTRQVRPIATPEHSRAMFARTLRSWAGELMELRRRGLDRPGFRRGAWYTAGVIFPPTGPSPIAAEAA